jgi:hypothetical protein
MWSRRKPILGTPLPPARKLQVGRPANAWPSAVRRGDQRPLTVAEAARQAKGWSAISRPAPGRGYETAKSRGLFRDPADATAQATVTDPAIEVRWRKRADSSLLPAAGFDRTDAPIPRLEGQRLRLAFG